MSKEEYNELVYKYNESLDEIYNLKKQIYEEHREKKKDPDPEPIPEPRPTSAPLSDPESVVHKNVTLPDINHSLLIKNEHHIQQITQALCRLNYKMNCLTQPKKYKPHLKIW